MKKSERKIIMINFKKISGEKAFLLARKLEKVDPHICEMFDVILALQPQDAYHISSKVKLPLFVQDISSYPESQFLSAIDRGSLKKSNIRGVILNHPQKKLTLDALEESIAVGRKLGLEILLCASSIDEAVQINDRYTPDYIAVENEQLIGKDISLVQYCPEVVPNVLDRINNRILFGGGIKSPEDIKFVIQNGGFGVLVASLIINSKNPLATLENLLKPEFYNKPAN